MKRLRSFKYAWQGLKDLWRTQPNMRLHVIAALLAIVFGWWLGINPTEWALIIVCISGVLAAEAFNTAIEYLTDLVSPDYHPLAGKVKDVSAAAVLLVATGSLIIGGMVLGRQLWDRLWSVT